MQIHRRIHQEKEHKLDEYRLRLQSDGEEFFRTKNERETALRQEAEQLKVRSI